MLIGGFLPFSFIDFPNKLSAVIFTSGCNFRCSFCHNKELVLVPPHRELLAHSQILEFLHKRKNQLEGVVITGGEPTLHLGLAAFLEEIKTFGYAVKLDTNGSNPQAIAKLAQKGLIDYVAMDIKAPLHKYYEVTKSQISVTTIQESISLLKSLNIDCEFRTTATKPLLSYEDLIAIGKLAQGRPFILQRFVNKNILDPKLAQNNTPFSAEEFLSLKNELTRLGISCFIR